jgi:hypothetical protein
MLKNISRAELVGAWVGTVIVTMACFVVAGMDVTISTGQLWLVAGIVPPTVMLLLWRGAAPATVAEVLHPTNRHQSHD